MEFIFPLGHNLPVAEMHEFALIHQYSWFLMLCIELLLVLMVRS
jgi:hypothetical protein